MTQVFEFASTRFDPSNEPENSINPIAGYSVLEWLSERLGTMDFSVSGSPDEEDWGWFITVTSGDAAYMVGASDQGGSEEGRTDWVVQVDKHRSFKEKLLGRNKLASGEEILQAIGRVLDEDPGIHDVSTYSAG